jgi:hypothetical protein
MRNGLMHPWGIKRLRKYILGSRALMDLWITLTGYPQPHRANNNKKKIDFKKGVNYMFFNSSVTDSVKL